MERRHGMTHLEGQIAMQRCTTSWGTHIQMCKAQTNRPDSIEGETPSLLIGTSRPRRIDGDEDFIDCESSHCTKPNSQTDEHNWPNTPGGMRTHTHTRIHDSGSLLEAQSPCACKPNRSANTNIATPPAAPKKGPADLCGNAFVLRSW